MTESVPCGILHSGFEFHDFQTGIRHSWSGIVRHSLTYTTRSETLPTMTSPAPQFRVRVTKDQLVFSAAHFITFKDNICERLHGHNWRASVEIVGPLDENQYVFDFIALRDHLLALVLELDHRVLLPRDHPHIRVSVGGEEVEARFAQRRWLFPKEDCVILPIANTTAERIAEWMGLQLLERIRPLCPLPMTSLQIEVEENFGQSAIVVLPWR